MSDAQRERLDGFAADVLHYNRAQNLISRREPERQLAALLEETVAAGTYVMARGYGGRSWADAGSGAGFPGLVLACLDPAQPITLIERRQGRCDFLRREVRAHRLGAVSVVEADILSHSGEPFDVVFAKALAPPGEVGPLCSGLVALCGVLVVFGRGGDRPGSGWAEAWSERLPGEDSVLRGLVRTGA